MNNKSWIIKAFIFTFFITIIISGLSNIIAENSNIVVLIIITLIILFLGIIFDIIGTSVLTAKESSFHAKAANKIKGSKECIKLIKNASTISSFCNDVIGDICGIVSGSMGTMIAIYITNQLGINKAITVLIVASIISSSTVGGKAIGKTVAVKKSDEIVFIVGKFLSNLKKEK